MEETKQQTVNPADNLDNILGFTGDAAEESAESIFELKVTLDGLMTPITKIVSKTAFCASLRVLSNQNGALVQ